VIDVGAHIGTFARRALAQGASRVISIEASPATAESLRRNLAEPIQAGKSSVFENAAWSSKGTLKFYTGGNMGDTTMDRGGREITVRSDTIDSIVEGLGLTRADLIKMDIEGAEVDALKGAAGVIRRFGPRLLIATEHRPEDLTAIPALITTIRPYAKQTPGPCILQPMRARVAPEYILFQ
jgi:FkbM family methyltransferase